VTVSGGASGTRPADWFAGRPGQAARLADPWAPRIFCFPHAGGSPRAFASWQAGLDDAEFLAICRPGREHRVAEPAPTIEQLIDGATAAITAVTEADGRPFYLFGHSLGALVAFEVCRRLPESAAPRRLLASGCSAPALLPSQRVKQIANLTGRDFAEAIGFFGGLPAEVIADEDMRELLLPALIADFHLAVGYRYRPGPRLTVPATLIVGRDDPHVKAEQIGPWDDEFTRPPDRYWVDGGHFYFEPQPAAAISLLQRLIQVDQHVELI